ncbi:MAG TPA: hypothetical protein VJA27_01405, partial [Patescibacteria group bacterium]|nr:hypothetical protein [Patescibacteria group bacterium]
CGPNNRGVCRADLTCFDPGAPSPDMGGPSEGFVVVSTCSTPTNVRFTNGGFGGADGWATVRLNDTGATQDKAVDQPNFGTDTRSIANMRAGICAVLLRWPGMGNGAAPPNGALTDLPHVGLNNVSAYWLDTGPTNFGWAHDNRHRR